MIAPKDTCSYDPKMRSNTRAVHTCLRSIYARREMQHMLTKVLLLLGNGGGEVQHIILAEREVECDRQYMMLKEFSVHLEV